MIDGIQTDPRLTTSWFQPDKEAILEQEAILASHYYLVKQGDAFGERLRCGVCQNRHEYITLLCIPRPITGLAGGLYAFFRAMKDSGADAYLHGAERTRYAEVVRLLQRMPDLSQMHPQLARTVTRDVGPSDMELGAVSLGILEGISRTRAKRFEDQINDKGIRPPYRMGVLLQADIDRSLEYKKRAAFSPSRW